VAIARHTLLTLAPLAGLWWLLSDADPTSWVIGLPAVAVAGWSARRLRPLGYGTIAVTGMLRFLPFFLWESLRGGSDVALRILRPRMRIRPGLTVYRTGLQRQDARVFFANCVCLVPGTLAADLDGDRLDIHLLDADSNPTAELQRLELAVSRIFPETP